MRFILGLFLLISVANSFQWTPFGKAATVNSSLKNNTITSISSIPQALELDNEQQIITEIIQSVKSSLQNIRLSDSDHYDVPVSGIIDYIGNTTLQKGSRWTYDNNNMQPFVDLTDQQLFKTKFNLWRQYPWKKIKGKFILTVKIGGELSLEETQQGFSFGSKPDLEAVDSIAELNKLFTYAARDPRALAIFIEFDRVGAGYAKLIELRYLCVYTNIHTSPHLTVCHTIYFIGAQCSISVSQARRS